MMFIRIKGIPDDFMQT